MRSVMHSRMLPLAVARDFPSFYEFRACAFVFAALDISFPAVVS